MLGAVGFATEFYVVCRRFGHPRLNWTFENHKSPKTMHKYARHNDAIILSANTSECQRRCRCIKETMEKERAEKNCVSVATDNWRTTIQFRDASERFAQAPTHS